jgi:16S rRNA (guanine966-N2)-methyltransferase
VRVIAGTARGIRLASVPGESTRPITDRVKESLFDILGGFVEGARVLDLFAGTGSVGIEALSRGAREVVFVERDRRAIATVRRNLEATHLADRAHMVAGDAFAYVAQPPPEPFDLIYIAPPQYKRLWVQALQAVDRPGYLTPEGLAIVQVFPKEDEPVPLQQLERTEERKYGSTLLIFYEPK